MPKCLLIVCMISLCSSLYAAIPGKFHDFAHIGDGLGIIRTTFLVMNHDSTPVNLKLSLFGDDGSPLALSIDNQTASPGSSQRDDQGANVESQVIELGPREHVAKLVDQLFNNSVDKGSIHVNASGQFTITSLQQTGLILGVVCCLLSLMAFVVSRSFGREW